MIPGVLSRYPNDQVASLKAAPWPQLLGLLGQSGEKIMINLLVDCALFIPVAAGLNNFYQVSGLNASTLPSTYTDTATTGNPISEVDVRSDKKPTGSDRDNLRKPSEITLVKSRMFYARPPMTSKGHIQPGYRHIRESVLPCSSFVC